MVTPETGGDNGIPGDNVGLGSFVECLSCLVDLPTFSIHAYESCANEEMGVKAVDEGLTMELGSGVQRPEIGGSLKDESKREAIRLEGVAAHLGIYEEGMVRGLGFGEAANKRVVHEDIRGGDVGEKAASIIYSIRNGDGGEEEELTEDEGMVMEASFEGIGVYLLELLEAPALLQQGNALL